MSSSWQPEHTRSIRSYPGSELSVLSGVALERAFADLYLWDPWPVLTPAGEPVRLGGAWIWMALSAPSKLQPSERHDVARIRLLSREGTLWRDHGNLFSDGATAGSREWAGCATYFQSDGRLEICYTASGVRGERSPSYVQRIFHCSAHLSMSLNKVTVADFSEHQELVLPGSHYRSTLDQLTGAAGYIKAFRDPFVFVDPADERLYLLFTGSLENSQTDYDGVVGVASGNSITTLVTLPPLLTADGVNNELERPHVVVHNGLYYVFFSTQAHTFHPEISAPTGLYGFVADRMDGDWRPLNGSGLVFRTPAAEPFQAYSWYVTQDLTVSSFVDFANLNGMSPEEAEAGGNGRRYFVGTIAPSLELSLQGDCALLKDEV